MKVFFVSLFFFLASGSGVAAEEVQPRHHLERAQICIDALDYECAHQELSKARPFSSELSVLEQRKLFELGAITALSMGQLATAEDQLRKLLDIFPAFRPAEGAWPPNWLNVLKRVRLGMPDKEAPQIVAPALVKKAYIGHDWVLDVQVIDTGGVAAVTLFIKVEGELKQIAMSTSGGEDWRGLVPGSWLSTTSLSYWIEAFDRAGNGPSKLGSIDEPYQLTIRRKALSASQPVYKKWWFWTALVGVAAVGGASYVLMSGSSPEPIVNPTGNLNVEIQWPLP